MGPRTAAVTMLVLLASTARAEAPSPRAKIARAALASAPPVIDGLPDEPAWEAAPLQDDFVERSPALRAAPAEHTSFRLLADGAALYVAIVCDDSQPETIRARTMQRDSMALFDDDAVSVKIDPLRDRQTTYGFTLNAAGGRMDYRAIKDSVWQIEVDLVWEGAAKRTATGWSAELRIPWSTLGIDPAGAPSVSGFDISRDHSRHHATYDWSLIAPPHAPIAASQYGALAGLPQLLAAAAPAPSRSTWAILPWALAGFDDAAEGDLELVGNAGLDVEADLGAGFAATLTLNTDFAQVEVDDVTTNLDRFDLFLPEKRDFFLRDGDLFAFGEAGWATLFHSRTIGLADASSAVEVPIVAGVKLGGRTDGGFRLGGLSVLTRPAEGLPWRLDSVLRLQQAFHSGSSLGFMSTWRQSLEDGREHNLTLGVDTALTSEGSPFLLQSFVAGSLDARARDDVLDVAGHIDLRWRGELFQPRIGYAYFGPSFRSALGYFQRTGIQDSYLELALVPRIGTCGLKTFTLASVTDLIWSAPQADLLDWSSELGAQLDWDSGLWVGLFGGVGEVTVDSFTIGEDHVVAAGTHGRSRIQLEGGTPSTEAVSATLSVQYREFFGGTAWDLGGSLIARPGTWLRAQLDAAGAFIALPSGDFVAPTLNLRLASSLTTDLELSAFGGWSGLDDTISLQARLRWTFLPGDDLFAVWEMRLDDDTGRAQHHSLIAKIALRLP